MGEAQNRPKRKTGISALLPIGLALLAMLLAALAVAAEPGWVEREGAAPEATIPDPPDYSISGVVFHDRDGDGEYADDGSEPGIGGVVVSLEPGGRTWTSNTTDEWGPIGGYWFDSLAPGQTYTLTCEAVPGYVSTSPAQVTGVTLGSGGTIPGTGPAIVHFGKAMTATVEIQLELQGRPGPPDVSWSVPVTYTVGGVYTDVVSASDLYGRVAIEGVVEGRRDLAVKNLHTLSTRLRDVQITAPTTVITMTLLEGDANDDDTVNSADTGVLSAGYWRAWGQPGFELGADFNEDRYIDARDASLLAANFFESGPVEATAGVLAETPALRLTPSAATVDVGDLFTVTVAIESGGRAVQAADVFVDYDARVLQVVDAAGQPDNQVHPITDSLGVVVRNQVLASDGVIGYAALSASDYTPGAYVDLFAIRFRAMRPTGDSATMLAFMNSVASRQVSRLCIDGYDELMNRYDSAITVEGTSMWLPNVRRNG